MTPDEAEKKLCPATFNQVPESATDFHCCSTSCMAWKFHDTLGLVKQGYCRIYGDKDD